jgi:hypothetical protein
MATGQVKDLYARKRVPVLVIGYDNRPKWSDIFENNPKIIRVPIRTPYQRLMNSGGVRPYIASKTPKYWNWRQGQVKTPGEIFFSSAEIAWAAVHGGRVLIEPNVKAIGHENKAWPFERWQQLVDRLHGMPFVQCAPADGRILRGVEHVVTPTFRHAAAVLAASKTFIGAEGGLMHAAAAVAKPSVILWSEFIAPTVTGYAMHRNIRHAGDACGSRIPCAGCVQSMLAISVDEVEKNLLEILG